MKGAPEVPAAPDPTAVAAAQGASNTSTAAAQAALNFVDQNTPYGSTRFNPTSSYTAPDGTTVPRYTQNVELSPLGQALLSGQQGVANTLIPTAQNLAGQAADATQKPLNFDTPFSQFLAKGPELMNREVVDSLYGTQKSFLDPQWNQQEQQLQDQLSRQGIPVGSEAYNNSMEQLFNSRTQAYGAAQSGAIDRGIAASSGMFGLAQAGQNQNLQQQQMGQQQPLALLSQLYGSTPATPTQPISVASPVGISPTDVVGANALSQKAAMDAYQAQNATANANNGALAGLASTAAIAAIY